MKISLYLKRIQCLIICLLMCGIISACMPTIKFGVQPRVDQLSTLKVGASSQADILMALGEPRGKGAARFSDAESLREGIEPYHDIWFYEYVETDGENVQLKFLLVFVDKDHYNGHFWFASSELMEKE
jgi:hypothetical protein